MKNNNASYLEKMPSWIYWGVCIALFLPITLLLPNFQPSDWTRTILFRGIITVLTCYTLFRFFYKRDISFSLPKNDGGPPASHPKNISLKRPRYWTMANTPANTPTMKFVLISLSHVLPLRKIVMMAVKIR